MFLFCSFVSGPVCFKINQNAPNHLVRRNLFLKDEPEEVNFGTHSSVILIGCVYNSKQAAQTNSKAACGPLSRQGVGGRTERNLPPHWGISYSVLGPPSLWFWQRPRGGGRVLPIHLGQWLDFGTLWIHRLVQWGHSEASALPTPAALAARLCDLSLLLLKWPRLVLIGLF